MGKMLSLAGVLLLLVVGAIFVVKTCNSAEAKAYITGYSYYDNTPPGEDISHPALHPSAGGIGTYDDPTTVAVGHSISGDDDKLDYKPGTRIYVPNVRRYFVVEDTCGDGPRPQDGPCHAKRPRGTSVWIDLWVGGQDSSEKATDRCMAKITHRGRVVFNPRSRYVVVPGTLIRRGRCTRTYGDTLIKSKKKV